MTVLICPVSISSVGWWSNFHAKRWKQLMRVLAATLVEGLMPPEVWVEQVKRAYVAFSAARAASPLRQRIHLSPAHEGRVAFMPAFAGEADALGCKIVGYYPANASLGQPVVKGIVVLIDPETGTPLALIDGTRLTDLRTGAIVAAAVQTLSKDQSSASEIALFGSGALARASVKFLHSTCGLRTLHVYSRSAERRSSFAQEIAKQHGLAVNVCSSPEEALAAARTIVCATATKEPVFPGHALRPGSFVISIGANTPQTRELDEQTIGSSILITESREATLAECGEVAIPIAEGRFGPEIVYAEIGEVLAGSVRVPDSAGSVVFKSIGLAVQDIMISRELLKHAEEQDAGERIELN